MAQAIKNGQIGCFRIDESFVICKKYYKDERTSIIMIQPASQSHVPTSVTVENMALAIIGRLASIISRTNYE